MEIWERVRGIRDAQGMLAKDVAAEIGVSRSFYTLLEGGKRRLTARHVKEISRALGVSVSEIYGDYGQPEPEED